MPTTMTSKNIPDDLRERRRDAARLHRRSVDSEAIVDLEVALSTNKGLPADRLGRVRSVRAGLGATFGAGGIDMLKRQGRP